MAALTIRFTVTASLTLDEILGFIAQDNPQAASKLAKRCARPSLGEEEG